MEVNQPHAHLRRRRGKTDAVDAEAAARKVLSGEAMAIPRIVIVRLRYCERTRAYAARRTTEGRSKREIIRCLKRYIAREVYRTLCADLASLTAA